MTLWAEVILRNSRLAQTSRSKLLHGEGGPLLHRGDRRQGVDRGGAFGVQAVWGRSHVRGPVVERGRATVGELMLVILT